MEKKSAHNDEKLALPNVLLTGSAGFIGFHVARALLGLGYPVVGLDNLNSYYSVDLKRSRTEHLRSYPQFSFYQADLLDATTVSSLFDQYRPGYVVHLAAQAGVRYSLTNPQAYVQSNIVGFANILEACRTVPPAHLLYASSSSVYGLNHGRPFTPSRPSDHPASLYAATKKANEVLAHSYSHLYGIPATGMRFFTVYGPWGRPDMAYYAFAEAMMAGKAIELFNFGKQQRDFTYVQDIVEAVVSLLSRPPTENPNWRGEVDELDRSSAPHRLLNLGNGSPVSLDRFVSVLEEALGVRAVRRYVPAAPGDAVATAADVSSTEALLGGLAHTPLETGIRSFAEWFLGYRHMNPSV